MISNVFKVAALCLAISSFGGGFANAQQRQNDPIDLAIPEGARLGAAPINITDAVLNGAIALARTGISMFGFAAEFDGYTLVRDGSSRTICVLDRYETTSNGNCGYTSLGITRNIFADLFDAAFSANAWRQYNAQTQNDLLDILNYIVADWLNPEYRVATNGVLNNNPFAGGYIPGVHHNILRGYINRFIRNNRPNGSLISDFNTGYAALTSYILGINISLITEHYGLVGAYHSVTGRALGIDGADEIFLLNIGNGHWQRAFVDQALSYDFNQVLPLLNNVGESLEALGILGSTYIPPSWIKKQ